MAIVRKTILLKQRRAIARYVLSGALAAAVAWPALAAEVTQSRLENANSEPQNWLLGFGNYQGHMFSRLTQINRDTVGNLKVAFTLPWSSRFARRGR